MLHNKTKAHTKAPHKKNKAQKKKPAKKSVHTTQQRNNAHFGGPVIIEANKNLWPLDRSKFAIMPDEPFFSRTPGLTEFQRLPREHALHNVEAPQEQWDYTTFSPTYGSQDGYDIEDKIENGTQSIIFKGYKTNSDIPLAIKTMMPISKIKLQRQAMILTTLKNKPHVVNTIDMVKDHGTTVSYISTWCENQPYFTGKPEVDAVSNALIKNLSLEEIKVLAFKMFVGLNEIHSQGIIHRDIHPGNVLLNFNKVLQTKRHGQNDVLIVDFDNAEIYQPGIVYKANVTTPGYGSPEHVIGVRDYHYSHDTFAIGLIMAQLIFPDSPVFRFAHPANAGKTEAQFIEGVLGTEGLANLVKAWPAYDVLTDDAANALKASQANGGVPKPDYKSIPTTHQIDDELVEVLDTALHWHPQDRLPASEITGSLAWFSNVKL